MARTAARSPVTIEDDQAAFGLAPLTETAIAAQTDAGSFKRGRGYARSGHIFGAFRRGNTLHARCHGSSGGPYLVEATLAKADAPKPQNPVFISCDCPRGGFCKHIVALLLIWIEQPESFEVRPPVADLLAGKSREELIALIELMLGENPDLEDLLELPVPVSGAPGDDVVDDAAIRRQIAAAMRDDEDHDRYDGRGRYGYDDYWPASRIAGKLERLAGLADAYAEAGNWRNTLRICAVLVEEIAPHLSSYMDTSGDLSELMVTADEHLAAGLDAQDALPEEERLSAAERTRLIDALFAIWQTSVDAGGIDLGEEGPEAVARSASPEEQRRVGDLLRQMLRPATGDHDQWNQSSQNQAAIGFLSLLGGDAGLSDEELLTEYRNAELWADAAEMLLRMDRVEEAIGLAFRQVTSAIALTPFADRLIATGDPQRIEQAIALVDDRLWEREGQNARDDEVLRAWLEKQYAVHGRPEKALELARGRFKSAPSRSAYDAVKAAALLPDQPDDPWPALRPTLISALGKRGDWYGLIDVHLAEGEIAEAIAALKKTEKPSRSGQGGWGYGMMASPDTYAARVAAAAEANFPDEAIRIYQRLAERYIAARGRPSYQTAAGLLVRVMAILEKAGRGDEWVSLIAELRERNKSLRALREELDALGLS